MMKYYVIALIVLTNIGCKQSNNNIKVELVKVSESGQGGLQNFDLKLYAEKQTNLKIHKSIEESFKLNTIKSTNLCEPRKFIIGDRKSQVEEIRISKSNPYVFSFSSSSYIDHNGVKVIDFGKLGKACLSGTSNIRVSFDFFKADMNGILSLLNDDSDGIKSNTINIAF